MLCPPPSLQLIAERVAGEREVLRRHAEALDAKAGVALGAAAAFVALLRSADTLASRVAAAAAAAAALASLLALLPHHHRPGDLRAFCADMLTAHPVQTRTALLDDDLWRHGQEMGSVRTRERLVTVATVLLGVAASVAAADLLGLWR